MLTEAIGWAASLILLATIGRQVYVQWHDESYEGLSSWLFVGQMSASVGFLVYSWLVHNWVFVVTNAVLLVTALLGHVIYRRNKRRACKSGDGEACG